jgi:hypothetical protein
MKLKVNFEDRIEMFFENIVVNDDEEIVDSWSTISNHCADGNTIDPNAN